MRMAVRHIVRRSERSESEPEGRHARVAHPGELGERNERVLREGVLKTVRSSAFLSKMKPVGKCSPAFVSVRQSDYFTVRTASLTLREPALCEAMLRTVSLSACVATVPLS